MAGQPVGQPQHLDGAALSADAHPLTGAQPRCCVAAAHDCRDPELAGDDTSSSSTSSGRRPNACSLVCRSDGPRPNAVPTAITTLRFRWNGSADVAGEAVGLLALLAWCAVGIVVGVRALVRAGMTQAARSSPGVVARSCVP